MPRWRYFSRIRACRSCSSVFPYFGCVGVFEGEKSWTETAFSCIGCVGFQVFFSFTYHRKTPGRFFVPHPGRLILLPCSVIIIHTLSLSLLLNDLSASVDRQHTDTFAKEFPAHGSIWVNMGQWVAPPGLSQGKSGLVLCLLNTYIYICICIYI